MRPEKEFVFKDENGVFLHHLYIGVLLMGWEYPINVLGFLIFLDDVIEHTVTTNTPLRLLWDKVIVPVLWKP